MKDFLKALRLSPALWKDGNFPSRNDYMMLLKRGCMLYALDLETNLHNICIPPINPEEADRRPINLLYSTCMQGYGRTGTKNFKGCAANELLYKYVEKYRNINREYHRYGIPVIIYQNENNFDEDAFSTNERLSFQAELEPFRWAFDNPGRRFACYNKPAWRDFLVERLLIRVNETEADGIFMDNNTPFLHCRCEYCRHKYNEELGGDLLSDIGNMDTVIGDMRAFYQKENLEGLVEVDRLHLFKYLEWRIKCHCSFHSEIRKRVLDKSERFLYYTSNGHISFPEQVAFMLGNILDMAFSEDGFSAPPLSNTYNLKLGLSINDWEKSPFIITRVKESLPTPGMLKVLTAEGKAMGGQAEFWEFNARIDNRLAEAQKIMRNFFILNAKDIYASEKDFNDTAIIYSWRSDILTSQSLAPAKMVSHLLEDMNITYDILIAEKASHSDRICNYKTIIMPEVQIISDKWFKCLQHYIDSGGNVISMGRTAGYNEAMDLRFDELQGDTYIHFEQDIYRDYFEKINWSNADYGIHGGYEKPAGPLPELLEILHKDSNLRIEQPTPLISINHTKIDNGEIIHLVNRFVNIFPFINPVSRENIVISIKRCYPISRILWLTPDNSKPVEISGLILDDNRINITVPTLTSYGIVKIEYKI